MTVQNYIGVNNEVNLVEVELTNEVEQTIDDRVEQVLRSVFSSDSTGTTPETSGVDASNYYTKAETDAAIAERINSVIVLLRDIFSNDSTGITPESSGVEASNYYTKEQTEAKIVEIVEYIKNNGRYEK